MDGFSYLKFSEYFIKPFGNASIGSRSSDKNMAKWLEPITSKYNGKPNLGEILILDDLATIFSVHNWPGHVSYVMIAISYWLTDIFWLRSMAIVGLALEILYFIFSGGDLRTGIGWDTIFIGINGYQLYRLWKDRLSLHLPEADRELLHSVLPGLSDVQIARLLLAGEFSEIPQGTTLTRENESLQRLFFICAGQVTVMISGRVISQLEKGNFVGEIAFITEKPATATVIAESTLRALIFDREKLSQFFRNEAEVAGLIYQLLGRELAFKIKISNSLISDVSRLA